jgi:hypothetical protein
MAVSPRTPYKKSRFAFRAGARDLHFGGSQGNLRQSAGTVRLISASGGGVAQTAATNTAAYATALGLCVTGDTIRFDAAGTYAINAMASTTKRITVDGVAGAKVQMSGTTGTAFTCGAHGIVFKNFEIIHSGGTAQRGIAAGNFSVTCSTMVFTGLGGAGLYLNGTGKVTVTGSTFTSARIQSLGGTIVGATIVNNTFNLVSVCDAAILAAGASGWRIIGNTINADNCSYGIFLGDSSAGEDTAMGSCVIAGNFIRVGRTRTAAKSFGVLPISAIYVAQGAGHYIGYNVIGEVLGGTSDTTYAHGISFGWPGGYGGVLGLGPTASTVEYNTTHYHNTVGTGSQGIPVSGSGNTVRYNSFAPGCLQEFVLAITQGTGHIIEYNESGNGSTEAFVSTGNSSYVGTGVQTNNNTYRYNVATAGCAASWGLFYTRDGAYSELFDGNIGFNLYNTTPFFAAEAADNHLNTIVRNNYAESGYGGAAKNFIQIGASNVSTFILSNSYNTTNSPWTTPAIVDAGTGTVQSGNVAVSTRPASATTLMAATHKVSSGVPVVSEGFEGSGALAGKTTTTGAKTWAAVLGGGTRNGAGQVTLSGAAPDLLYFDCGLTEYDLTYTIQTTANDYFGASLQVVDVNNFEHFRFMADGTVRSYQKIAGADTWQGNSGVAFTPGATITVHIRSYGKFAVCFVDNMYANSIVRVASATSSRVGIYGEANTAVKFDSLDVRAFDTGLYGTYR